MAPMLADSGPRGGPFGPLSELGPRPLRAGLGANQATSKTGIENPRVAAFRVPGTSFFEMGPDRGCNSISATAQEAAGSRSKPQNSADSSLLQLSAASCTPFRGGCRPPDPPQQARPARAGGACWGAPG
eukprot:448902-Alexandrium_andersonii.AAC.1